MTVGQLCRHIVHLVHTPIGVYSETGERTAFYVDHGEQQDLFARDPAFLREPLEKRDPDCPILYIEGQRAVYGIACGGTGIYLMGPCALGHDAVTTAKYLVRAHRLDPKVPYRVCTTSIGYFSEMLIMLFEMLTGRTVGESDLFFHSFCDRDFRQSLDEKVHDVFYELHEAGAIHNPYSQELREQEAIRTGDLVSLQESFRETYVGKVGTLAADPLRHEKNMAIVLVVLGCRSAIAGGLLPEVAFSMSDASTQSHFGQAFKKWVGMTPGQYRKTYGKET